MSATSTTVFEDHVNELGSLRDELATVVNRVRALKLPLDVPSASLINEGALKACQSLEIAIKELDDAIQLAASAGGIGEEEQL